jgi:transcriptional regulator with PAS, ATPase and Fis domain
MTGNVELLDYVYQNSEMGHDTLKQLLSMVEDGAFKQVLESQFREYDKIFTMSEEKLRLFDKEAKGIKVITKISTYIMINLKTLANKSPSHIAEMLIQGSTMGIIDITKKIKEYEEADNDTLYLANNLLEFEKRNIEELKKFL